ncbi:unnamed protein product [Caenorhabditis bovis]|uniref:Carbohydrate sulfotransferase n=1 Tax=Caenorhabditis bovis TaxID=2654633 RepID=A0A8S1F3Z9_9PELO|nr:unnamed protein product [Caenorhabditis bovis]
MQTFIVTTCALLLSISVALYYLLTTTEILGYVKIAYESRHDSVSLSAIQKEALRRRQPLVPPFIDLDREYAIAPKYNLSICRIKKSMSTLMSGISCVLFDTDTFLRLNRSITETWSRRFCANKNEYSRIGEVKWRMGAARANFTKIAVVRNPISRFVSFFINKCIQEAAKFPNRKQCYDCQGDVKCFLERQYKRFMKLASGAARFKPGYEDKHASPLSWNCEFNRHLNEYKLVKLESDPARRQNGLNDLLKLFREQNVPNSTIDYIRKNAMEKATPHSTFSSSEKKRILKLIADDRAIRDYLRRIYYLDFIIFDFDARQLDD